MKRGLTLGKYAPLHLGHQFVIDQALAEMDEVVVLIYDAPDVTDIPLPVRAAWLRTLYPTIKVIEARGGPTKVGYSPAIKKAHETYVINLLGGCNITHFYSSEPYGEHMSRALGAINRPVDLKREKFSISATRIREDAFSHRDFVAPLVYRDLITKVAFLGAPSAGKTTLARHISRLFQTAWMPEYGREYWEKHQIDRRLTPEQLVEIAEGHLEREDALLLQSNRYLFCDTNALTTAIFAEYYHRCVNPRLREIADQAAERYDLTFVCDIDIPYEDTWDRSGEVNRAVFQQQIIEDLLERNIPYFLISGNLQERTMAVRRVLENFRKYKKLAPLRR